MAEIQELRDRHYNATVEEFHLAHEDLAILRIRPDDRTPRYQAGQHTLLGLGYWEPRLDGCQEEELPERLATKLARRAYSFSSTLIDEQRRLVPPGTEDLPEFLIALVRKGEQPPVLTPRLFRLRPGDRLFLDPTPHGQFTLDGVYEDQDVVFFATGAGEAPFNTMLTELLARRHQGRIVLATCVRYQKDLAYQEKHRELERFYSNYSYITLTTREPENLDARHPEFQGKVYLQELLASGRFEERTRLTLDPVTTHVFLCGTPDMIGAPRHTRDPEHRYPPTRGMVEILENRRFTIHHPNHPGNLHYERYW